MADAAATEEEQSPANVAARTVQALGDAAGGEGRGEEALLEDVSECHPELRMEGGEMEVGRMEVGRMEVGRMEVGRMEVGEMEVGEMEVGEMEVGEMEVVEMEVVELEVGEMEDEDFECEDEGEDSWCNNPEMKRLYMEYLDLVKTIQRQNITIEEMKSAIARACAKPAKTKCELKDIQRLRCCCENESNKLHCLMQKAMQLQNSIPREKYEEIPIATTLDEDNQATFSGFFPKAQSESDPCSSCQQTQKPRADPDEAINRLCDLSGENATCHKDEELAREIRKALSTLQEVGRPRPYPVCIPCPCSCPSATNELEKLKSEYNWVLAEYVKKDAELTLLREAAQHLCKSSFNNGNEESPEEAELKLLRCKVCEYQEEQEEFKCLFKEQSEQLEEYRSKYMKAQQKVDEQATTLKKVNMRNKRIENQIKLHHLSLHPSLCRSLLLVLVLLFLLMLLVLF